MHSPLLLLCCVAFAVVVPVDNGPTVSDSELVAAVRHKLRQATKYEVYQMFNDVEIIKELLESRELELLDAGPGSVRLFWWCRTRRSLDCLLVCLDTGRLLTASQQLVNLVSPHRQLAVSYACIGRNVSSYVQQPLCGTGL